MFCDTKQEKKARHKTCNCNKRSIQEEKNEENPKRENDDIHL
jgi:hypothetical protein